MIHYVDAGYDIDRLNCVDNDCLVMNVQGKKKLYYFREGQFLEIPIYKRKIRGKNVEHHMFTHFFNDDDVKIIQIMGPAGSGKTYMPLGSALEAVLHGTYQRIVIIRELVPTTDHPMGHLPGTADEKTGPLFECMYDAVSSMAGTGIFRMDCVDDFAALVHQEVVQFTTLEFLRGRTLSNAVIICDDAQNLRIKDVRTIITRVGENSKIILNGDTSQTDNDLIQRKDKMSGLEYLKAVGYGHKEYAMLDFTHSELRSEIVAKFLQWEKQHNANAANGYSARES